MSKTTNKAPVEIKFSKVGCLFIGLLSGNHADLLSHFSKRIGQGSGGVYSGEIAVVDGTGWNDNNPPPIGELLLLAKQANVRIIAAKSWPTHFASLFEQEGIAWVEESETKGETKTNAQGTLLNKDPIGKNTTGPQNHEINTQPVESSTTMVIENPIRSGQKIYARGCDAIVMGPVNPGGEIIADGHIHIYGALKGRALAGANGNRDAKIFTIGFAPELVAIAGIYTTFEKGFSNHTENQAVCVSLQTDHASLNIEPLNIR